MEESSALHPAAAKPIPNPLFKYFPPERIDVLEKQRIAFTPPIRFNDPFELSPYIRDIKCKPWMKQHVRVSLEMWKAENPDVVRKFTRKERRQIEKHAVKVRTADMLAQGDSIAASLQDHLQRSLSEQVGFLCLSAVADNLLMWAHYCQSHEGFVLALNTTATEFSALGSVAPIHYSAERPQYDVALGPKDEHYWTKSKQWDNEQEYRVLRMLKTCVAQKGSDGVAVHLAALPRACISSVYLGVRMSAENKARIRKLLSGSGVPISEASLDRKRFALCFTCPSRTGEPTQTPST
jgi:hypothetical protein